MPEAKARRADAEQNRSAIIEAAGQALAVDGAVSLNAIAKLAGVGNATLYRHFPTREALILEVYRREVRALAETADELLQRHDPGQALERWVARLAQYAMTKHGLAQALRTVTASEISENSLFAETYQPIVAALGRLLAVACRRTRWTTFGSAPDASHTEGACGAGRERGARAVNRRLRLAPVD